MEDRPVVRHNDLGITFSVMVKGSMQPFGKIVAIMLIGFRRFLHC